MDHLEFAWDRHKNDLNVAKHGVSFEEAATVFDDPYALVVPDLDHSIDEERFVILGMSMTLRILVVCHCYREQEGEIRLISARKATKYEIRSYKR